MPAGPGYAGVVFRPPRAAPLLVALLLLSGSACRTDAPSSAPVPETPAARTTPTPGPVVPPPPPPEEVDTEVRGVWVHLFDGTLKTAAGIDRMLDAVAGAGANTVIVEVVRRHDAYYDSRVLPRSTDPALEPDLDVLRHTIDGGRARGLAVHAWYPAAPVYHHAYDELPRPPGWVWEAHGPQAPEEQRWVTRSHDGRWGDYLDPGVEAVQDHLVDIAAELAAAGPDAVHLDYVRYNGADWGYHPEALARFQAETGSTAVPGPRDPVWSDWRRAQTRLTAQRIRDAVTKSNPDVEISAAVIAQGEGPGPGRPFGATRAYAEFFQDWPSWLGDGLIDAAYPMVYFNQRSHPAWFDAWLEHARALRETTGKTVAVGIGAWLNTVDHGHDQVLRAGAVTDGAVLFSYQQNADAAPHDGLLQRLATTTWAEPAPP